MNARVETRLDEVVAMCRHSLEIEDRADVALDTTLLEIELLGMDKSDQERVSGAFAHAMKQYRAGKIRLPWLYGAGLANVAFVASRVAKALGSASPNLGTLIESLQQFLDNYPDTDDIDLPTGALGIGVLGLELGGDVGAGLVAHVLSAYDRRVESGPDGDFLRSAPNPFRVKNFPEQVGSVNLGLAHGMPGVIAFLARVHGTYPQFDVVPRLENAVRFVLSQQRQAQAGGLYPEWGGNGYRGARLAWCYGDLGVWEALRSAKTALPDLEGEIEALQARIVSQNQERDIRDCAIRDGSVCHGAAGLLLIGRRMGPALQSKADWALEELLSTDLPFKYYDAREGYERRMDLLDGDIGVALTLLDYLGFNESGRMDRLLLSVESQPTPQNGTLT